MSDEIALAVLVSEISVYLLKGELTRRLPHAMTLPFLVRAAPKLAPAAI